MRGTKNNDLHYDKNVHSQLPLQFDYNDQQFAISFCIDKRYVCNVGNVYNLIILCMYSCVKNKSYFYIYRLIIYRCAEYNNN